MPKDIVICDWQYGYPEKDGKAPYWVTARFFRDAGFDVLPSTFLDRRGTRGQGRFAAANGLLGLLQTTWHLSRLSYNLDALFVEGATAAWNPQAERAPGVVYKEYLNRHLREMAWDMGLREYTQLGSVPYQIPPEQAGD